MNNKNNKNTKSKNLLCFVAGKSGGHLIPAITIAQNAAKQNTALKVMFFSTNSAIDNKILQDKSVITKRVILNLDNVPTGQATINKLIKYPIFLINLTHSFFKSFFNLVQNRPYKVISTGGYISIPVCLAAFCLRIPIELFEVNTTAGKAISFLAPFATNINVCFPKAINYLPAKKCKLANYPIRFEHDNIIEPSMQDKTENVTLETESFTLGHKSSGYASPANTGETKSEAFTKYGFSPNKLTLLILGGSQGSQSINNLIRSVVEQNPNWSNNLQIIHQTGEQNSGTNSQTASACQTGAQNSNSNNLSTVYKNLGFSSYVFPFDNDQKNIQQYYNLADLVICRSGAGSLFETLFFQKKCITIPLESATTDHQVDNAAQMEKMHPQLFKMIKQQDGLEKLSLAIEAQIKSFV